MRNWHGSLHAVLRHGSLHQPTPGCDIDVHLIRTKEVLPCKGKSYPVHYTTMPKGIAKATQKSTIVYLLQTKKSCKTSQLSHSSSQRHVMKHGTIRHQQMMKLGRSQESYAWSFTVQRETTVLSPVIISSNTSVA